MNIIFYKLQNKLNDVSKLRTLTSTSSYQPITLTGTLTSIGTMAVGAFKKDTTANKIYFTTVYRNSIENGDYNTYRYLTSSDSVTVTHHSYTQIL